MAGGAVAERRGLAQRVPALDLVERDAVVVGDDVGDVGLALMWEHVWE